ncbi:unnamed protein product, partial [Polarella glacialis]
LGSVPPASELVRSGSPSLLQSCARLGPPLPATSPARSGSPLLVADSLQLGLSSLPRSFAKPGLSALVSCACQAGPSLAPRSAARLDTSLLVIGVACLETSLPVPDPAGCGSPLLIRSAMKTGKASSVVGSLYVKPVPLPVVEFVQLGALLPSQNCARTGASLPMFGITCPELSPAVLDFGLCGSPPPIHSSAHPNASATSLGISRFRRLWQLAAAEELGLSWKPLGPLSNFGPSRPGAPPPAVDFLCSGLPLPPRSLAQLDLLLLVIS